MSDYRCSGTLRIKDGSLLINIVKHQTFVTATETSSKMAPKHCQQWLTILLLLLLLSKSSIWCSSDNTILLFHQHVVKILIKKCMKRLKLPMSASAMVPYRNINFCSKFDVKTLSCYRYALLMVEWSKLHEICFFVLFCFSQETGGFKTIFNKALAPF